MEWNGRERSLAEEEEGIGGERAVHLVNKNKNRAGEVD